MKICIIDQELNSFSQIEELIENNGSIAFVCETETHLSDARNKVDLWTSAVKVGKDYTFMLKEDLQKSTHGYESY